MTPHRMKVHLARCNLGASSWRDAVRRMDGVVSGMRAACMITDGKSHGEEDGEGYVGLSWTFLVPAAGPGFAPRYVSESASFRLRELHSSMTAVIEVLES